VPWKATYYKLAVNNLAFYPPFYDITKMGSLAPSKQINEDKSNDDNDDFDNGIGEDVTKGAMKGEIDDETDDNMDDETDNETDDMTENENNYNDEDLDYNFVAMYSCPLFVELCKAGHLSSHKRFQILTQMLMPSVLPVNTTYHTLTIVLTGILATRI
jgi:hypothetical protein